MADELQFWVGNSSTLAKVYKINKISSASIDLKLNNAGSVNLTVDRSEPAVVSGQLAVPLSSCILVYRSGSLVWSGPIWNVDENYSGESQKVTIVALGWFELLNHRLTRNQPGYSLITSPITFTNATFESALSGWTGTNGTAARDTTVFRTGAGSLRLAENIASGFWPLTGDPIEAHSYIQANALGSTPTAGKRYRLNFYARARKDARLMNASLPYVEILESSTRVGYQEFTTVFSSGSRNTTFAYPNTFGGSVTMPQWTTTGTFVAQSVEWVSSGVAPTIRFGWDVQVPQFADTAVSWTPFAGSITDFSGGILFGYSGSFNMGGSVVAMTGELDTARSYTMTFEYEVFTRTNFGFAIYNSAGSSLGSVSRDATPGTYTDSFSFTPASLPIRLEVAGSLIAPVVSGSSILLKSFLVDD